MGKRLLNNACLFVVLMATACATPKPMFYCKRDPAYTQKIDRVLVISLNENFADEVLRRHFSRTVTGKLLLLLNKRKVQMHVASPNPTELDPDAEVLQTIATYRPHQILYFSPTNVRRGATVSPSYGRRIVRDDVGNVSFEVKLMDVASHRTVWRSDMSYWFEPEPDQVAVDLVDRLAIENLLPAAQ
jgi:hypothetical protein